MNIEYLEKDVIERMRLNLSYNRIKKEDKSKDNLAQTDEETVQLMPGIFDNRSHACHLTATLSDSFEGL